MVFAGIRTVTLKLPEASDVVVPSDCGADWISSASGCCDPNPPPAKVTVPSGATTLLLTVPVPCALAAVVEVVEDVDVLEVDAVDVDVVAAVDDVVDAGAVEDVVELLVVVVS